MEQSTATRRLVKSPPELWAELSTEDSLSRHLAKFGEIRITRVEPETTVAWEGDRFSGTVELAPTGWGTKVVLTAVPVAEPPADPAAPAAVTVVAEVPVPATPSAPTPFVTPAADKPRGFFARLFRRRPASSIPAPPAPGPDPSPPTPSPSPGPLPPAPDPVPPTPAPQPPAPPSIVVSPSKVVPAPDRAVAILDGVLDDLGSAHHRPFSRD